MIFLEINNYTETSHCTYNNITLYLQFISYSKLCFSLIFYFILLYLGINNYTETRISRAHTKSERLGNRK